MGNTDPPSSLPMKALPLLGSKVDFLGWLSWFIPPLDCIPLVLPSFLPLESKTFLDTKFLGGHVLCYPRTTPIHQPPRALPELTKPQVSPYAEVTSNADTPDASPEHKPCSRLKTGLLCSQSSAWRKELGHSFRFCSEGFHHRWWPLSCLMWSFSIWWPKLFCSCCCTCVYKSLCGQTGQSFPLWFLLSLHSKKITVTVIIISPCNNLSVLLCSLLPTMLAIQNLFLSRGVKLG